MATELECGSGGSTGLEVITRINQLSELDPRATGHLLTAVSVDVDDTTPVLLPCVDDAKTQRGGFEVDTTNYRLVNNSGNDYESVIVTIGLNVRFAGTEQLDIWAYKNGQPYSTSEFTIQGRGTNKPVAVFWQSDISLLNGDYIDLRAQNADTGTFTCVLERVQFRIDADRKDVIA
jgi:hypothetical protein